MTYYERTVATHLDGSPIFATEEDREHERVVAAEIERVWDCRLHPFGPLSAIDYYATRDGRMTGLVEIKTRSHASDEYVSVFLNVRKWLALQLAGIGLGVPAMFFVKFTDRIMWVDVARVDATRSEVAGCGRVVKALSDVEPVIHVDITQMQELAPDPAYVNWADRLGF